MQIPLDNKTRIRWEIPVKTALHTLLFFILGRSVVHIKPMRSDDFKNSERYGEKSKTLVHVLV